MPLAFQLGADSALARCADLYCRVIATIRHRELSMGTPVSQQTRDIYWRENRRLMLILGFFWFVVSLGMRSAVGGTTESHTNGWL